MIKLFSGSAHPKLSEEISKLLHLPLSKSEVVHFNNSETRVTVKENVKNKICVVIQSTSSPTDTHLMEIFFFADALKKNRAKKIIGVLPYFGYARQNHQHRPGECVSANVVVSFLESVGFDEIHTIDLHDEATEGIFTIPFKNLSALPLLAKEIRKYLYHDRSIDNIVIVSPDQGGVERARNFAKAFFSKQSSEPPRRLNEYGICVVEKKRDLNKIHQSEALDLYGDVKEKTVILVDDIVTSGATLINACDLCLKRGAKEVIAAITHHDFAKETPKKIQQSKISKLFTTGTIRLDAKQKFPKLEEISIASLIANELSRYI